MTKKTLKGILLDGKRFRDIRVFVREDRFPSNSPIAIGVPPMMRLRLLVHVAENCWKRYLKEKCALRLMLDT